MNNPDAIDDATEVYGDGNFAMKPGDRVWAMGQRKARHIWWDRIRTLRWNVPTQERREYKVIDTYTHSRESGT